MSRLLTSPPAGKTAKILFPLLCRAAADAAMAPGRVVPLTLSAGTLVRRAIPGAYAGDPKKTTEVRSAQNNDNNRMDGITPMGPTRSALYTSLDTAAVAAEGLHYSKKWTGGPILEKAKLGTVGTVWMPTKALITCRLTTPIRVLDLRRDSGGGMALVRGLNTDAAFKSELRAAGYAHLLLALQNDADYSAARGLAYAADKLGLDGVVWNTARISQHADRFADNLSLFGPYGAAHPSLEVLFVQDYADVGGTLVYKVRSADPGRIDPKEFAPFPDGVEV